MLRLPIRVPVSVIHPMLASLLRMVLVAAGVALQDKGWLPADMDLEPVAASIIGQLMIVAGVLWTQFRVVKTVHEKQVMEPYVPDSVAVRADTPHVR